MCQAVNVVDFPSKTACCVYYYAMLRPACTPGFVGAGSLEMLGLLNYNGSSGLPGLFS